ncbi:hypothetical protein ACWER6_11970 [Streptomyces sp. NPDC004009]
MQRYRRMRRKGLPSRELRTVEGPRIRAKAGKGWRGARLSKIVLTGGVLCLLAGAGMLAGAALLAPAGARLVVDGLYFAGLGVGIVMGHPISVLLARRRWAARVSEPLDGAFRE